MTFEIGGLVAIIRYEGKLYYYFEGKLYYYFEGIYYYSLFYHTTLRHFTPL